MRPFIKTLCIQKCNKIWCNENIFSKRSNPHNKFFFSMFQLPYGKYYSFTDDKNVMPEQIQNSIIRMCLVRSINIRQIMLNEHKFRTPFSRNVIRPSIQVDPVDMNNKVPFLDKNNLCFPTNLDLTSRKDQKKESYPSATWIWCLFYWR